jgi:hypothetical protein
MIFWYHQLDNATSTLAVVGVVRDYLASWSPAEIGKLSESVRPGKIRDEQDVEILHTKLVEEYRSSRATGDELDALQRFTSLMVRASIRLAELRDDSSRDGSASPSSGPMKSLAPRDG